MKAHLFLYSLIVVIGLTISTFGTAYAAIGTWSVSSLQQLYVEPNQSAVISFEAATDIPVGDIPTSDIWNLYDSNGRQISTGKAVRHQQQLSLTLSVPQGFFEVEFPETQQRFGIVSLPAFTGGKRAVDRFFAIDGALSWLVNKDKDREELIKIAKRVGIGTIRGRLSWSEIEPKEGEFHFDGHRRYNAVRQWYQENDIDFLEVIHDAPRWTGKTLKYPLELVKTARSWDKMQKHWSTQWTSLEVWNEPDISFGGDLPANQYVPLLKSIKSQFSSSGAKTIVVGGVLATHHPQWLDNAAANGILDACDVFSFHTYDRASNMEKICGIFQKWLETNGHPGKELWLTECGRPWKKGTARPTIQEDYISTIDIVMKAVEAKCCRIDRYFPFVYPYYEENENNFGMTDRNGAPLRSFAGFATMIDVLAGWNYIGDLNDPGDNITRARVFNNDKTNHRVVVYYTAKPDAEQKLLLPFVPLAAYRVTGESLAIKEHELDFADGFAYVTYGADVSLSINTHTEAATLNRARREAARAVVSKQYDFPIVLSYRYDTKQVVASPSGYEIHRELDQVNLQFVVFNLSEQEQSVSLDFSTNLLETPATPIREITVPGGGSQMLDFTLDNLTSVSELQPLLVTVQGTTKEGCDRLVLRFTKELSMENTLKLVTEKERLPLENEISWQKNQPVFAQSEFCKKEELESSHHWGFKASFGEGDRWIYPRFTLPADTDFSKYDGFIIRAKCSSPDVKSLMRVICTESNKEQFMTQKTIVPADGQWHLAIVPFETLSLLNNAHNNILDRDQIREISIGGNTKGKTFDVEVSDFYLFKAKFPFRR